jgi:hypothetical protein
MNSQFDFSHCNGKKVAVATKISMETKTSFPDPGDTVALPAGVLLGGVKVKYLKRDGVYHPVRPPTG